MNALTPVRRRVSAIILSSVFALIILPVFIAVGCSKPTTSAEKKLSDLPLTGTFGKGTPGENGGPYALTLKNTSQKALTVNATIIWSVTSHNRAKTVNMPPQEIAADGTWMISDLAAEDRVVLAAEGYEPLELKTPPGK